MSFSITLIASLLFASYVACATVGTNPSPIALTQNDNEVLAFALFVENFDTNYYAKYLDPSSPTAFSANDFVSAGYTAEDYALFNVLLANERAHVNLLNSLLQSRNGSTVPPCIYNYPATSNVRDFVFYSKLFENVGTAAYDGGISAIYDKDLQTGAATVATVEARHAAYLNSLATYVPAGAPAIMNGLNVTYPFPNTLDIALVPTDVVSLIRPFLNSCPYSISFNPTVNVIIPVAVTGALPNPSAGQVEQNDINTANFALTLEILEATFYNRFYPTLTVDSFTSIGLSATDYAYFGVVTAHENMHVLILSTAITAAGGTPVSNCTYTFNGVTAGDALSFITTSALLENTGVSAYDGAINTINSPTMRQVAATIATVEARHAAIISRLTNSSNPYSSATDAPVAPADIVATIVNAGIVSPTTCAAIADSTKLPQVLTIYSYNNNTAAPAPTSTPTTSTTTASTSTTSSASYVASFCLINTAIALIALF